MRTIKFRGYGIVEKKWFYGNLVEGNAGRYITDAYYEEGQGDMIRYDPIQTKTIGQFTGLVDKDGKEIYEGDIVKYYTLETITNDLTQPIENVIVERCGVITYVLSSFVIKDDDDYDVELKYYSKDYHVESPESVDAVNADKFPFITNENDLCKIEVIGNIHDNPELMKI